VAKSDKTRKLIIEKTAPIFNKKGYAGTYLSDLADATGLTKGSIYGNFKDKNEVAVEAYRYNYNFQTKELLDKINQESNSADKLLVFLRHYKEAYREIFENGGCAVLNTAVDTDDGNVLLRSEVIKSIHHWHDQIARILNAGVEKNELQNIEISEYAFRMIALIEGSILLAKTLDKPDILLKNIAFMETEIQRISIDG